MRVKVDKVVSSEHISALERLCENTKDKELFLHAQALILRSQGKTLKQIREALGVPEATVKFYTKRLKQEGIAGLSTHRQGGNRSLLTKEQLMKLRVLLSQSEAWFSEQIKWYLLAEFGISYADSSHSITKLMKQMGYIRDPRTEKAFITPETQKNLPPALILPQFPPEDIAFLKSLDKKYHFKPYKW